MRNVKWNCIETFTKYEIVAFQSRFDRTFILKKKFEAFVFFNFSSKVNKISQAKKNALNATALIVHCLLLLFLAWKIFKAHSLKIVVENDSVLYNLPAN